MSLIDVSVLKEWVENWFTKNRQYHPYAKNNNIPITELYDILEQIPTIDPVRKGKWIDKDGGIATCSECGDRWGVHSVMKFCPSCGAKMEEPEDIPMEYFESGGR